MWQDILQSLKEKHIQMPRRFLTRQEVRAFYDRFGRKQDKQHWYESPATQHLIKHGGFETAMAVFELGCGTGVFAEEILSHSLPKTAHYCGVDISSTMVELSRKRLARFEGRAEVLLTDGALKFALPDASVDRFVMNYVLDLLSPDDIRQVLTEAYRLLKPEGRLCVVSLTCGRKGVARLITWLWSTVHWLHPKLVGGCRSLRVQDFLDEEHWRLDYHHVVIAFGVASEVVVASKYGDNRRS
jgi:ubiquinone/menaquinone biosynthesis C-methylase UbiE